MATFDTSEALERFVIFGASTDKFSPEELETSLDELTELLATAGAEVVGRITQNREVIDRGLYFGKGKVDELKTLALATDATGVICDDELTPAQLRNLTDALDLKVADRTTVILDIFALHAGSREGKLQVELAQLKFRSTRLTGFGKYMSRQGGGIGTRGPGEKKLETDRRVISDRISALKADLRQMENQRDEQRKSRSRSGVPVVSIVGYTNAGKSTLLNKLTDAGVLEQDMLFATLDPTTRSYKLPSGQQVLFTDTVGFIRKLPHHLVEAFRSTLEEAKYSDVILHVVDVSDPNFDANVATVYDTLDNLKATEGGKPVITVFNKIDRLEGAESRQLIKDLRADKSIFISAKTGEGLEELELAIEEILRNQKEYIHHTFAYSEGAKLAQVRKYGEIIAEEYLEDGIFIEAYVPKSLML